MQVYIKHGGVWLRIKEVYTIQPTTRKRRGRQQPRSSPYGIVAESVESIELKGYKYSKEIAVPAMKVSRFAARLHLEPGEAIVVIEEYAADRYKAMIYAKNKTQLEEAVNRALTILSSLQVGRGRTREEVDVEEAEELEEEEEVEGEE
ncbi:hypothetical protein [Hyperthermus butylicus]|uniref:hypothetical protein n=1 Tax=Hyperthermus butylicus TaxID=54248 RepID=UPI00064FD397|nr:hypothetical protein [Hyperthermus butylicus]